MLLRSCLVLISTLITLSFLAAQTTLPVLHSTDTVLTVRINGELSMNTWTLVPELRPDPYTSSTAGDRITFVSDLDSISAVVTPGQPFDFVVVCGKDSAYTRVVYEQSKLDVLKQHPDFLEDEDRAIPAFTYASSELPELKALRKKYNLDSIAGQGTDISQMLNLMRWVHNMVEHNGNRGNSGDSNADAYLSSCSKGQGTLNCRGLATVLNEVYLSMGFPSHFVTCFPKDTTDMDCHVINTAYSEYLDKWVWLDPTQNAYVMDEQGTLLSIPEVRERLINDQVLILNPDANWNYRGTTDKAWYLEYYMAKNLFRFSTPLHSTYNYETTWKGKERVYVELWPAGEGDYLPATSHNQYSNGSSRSTYRTHNPGLFWTLPPAELRKR